MKKYLLFIICLFILISCKSDVIEIKEPHEPTQIIYFRNENFDRVYDLCLTETDQRRRNSLYREAQRIITGNAASVYIQDIFYFKVFKSGSFGGVLNYPLYVIDFASIYGIEKN